MLYIVVSLILLSVLLGFATLISMEGANILLSMTLLGVVLVAVGIWL